jgi:DNA repair and recombination protein RAD52
MLNDKQNQALSYELDSSRIKTRSKNNINLSYVEGHDIIETANKIFGYGNWSYSISKLEHVSQETNQNQNVVICYKAIVNVVVHDLTHSKHISREDVGFGTGIAKSLADAHEGGAKEAVTDAIKRSFRSFGNQFGNSLYDKSRVHHNQQPAQLEQPQQHQAQAPAQVHNNIPQDYASLYKIGLTVVNQGNHLIVVGEDIFAKKDSIKAYGFRWDGVSKCWYKPIEQQAA